MTEGEFFLFVALLFLNVGLLAALLVVCFVRPIKPSFPTAKDYEKHIY